MRRSFVKFPPLFFHRDKDFMLFERSHRAQFPSQRVRDIAQGLKYYALLYNQQSFSAAQLGLTQNLIVSTPTALGVLNQTVKLPQLSLQDLERNFIDPSNTLVLSKITEPDFKLFFEQGLDEAFRVYVNPKIIDYGAEKVLSVESSVNLFYLRATIARSANITVQYQDIKFEEFERRLEGPEAVAFQQSYDYLLGMTILNLSRNLGRVEASDVFEQHLPQSHNRLNALMSEVRQFTEDPESQQLLESESQPHPDFLEKEYEQQFDRLLEEVVNEYEAKFEIASD